MSERTALESRTSPAVSGDTEASAPPTESQDYSALVARLRGSLDRSIIGARELSALLHNPTCNQLPLLVAAEVSSEQVAQVAYGDKVSLTGSRLALSSGINFERRLCDDHFARLIKGFEMAGMVPADKCAVLDLSGTKEVADERSAQEREARTRELLWQAYCDGVSPHDVLWHPRLPLRVPGVASGVVYLEPDTMLFNPDVRFFEPGDVKAYKDRGWRTKGEQLSEGRIQAALSILAMRQMIADQHVLKGIVLDARQLNVRIPASIHLILRAPRSRNPKAHRVRVSREVGLLDRALRQLQQRVSQIVRDAQSSSGLAPDLCRVDSTEGIATTWSDVCPRMCALSVQCLRDLRKRERPLSLGPDMAIADELGTPLHRLVDLTITGAAPETDTERALVRRARWLMELLTMEAQDVS